MEAVVKKWGNSLGVRIPNAIVKEMSFKDGSLVEIKSSHNEIIIRRKQKIKLSDFIKNINKKNIHVETNSGVAIGNEIW
ncbi:MAG: AbrB/MazE/SpoVT family DNA-binding domain-containing protein [Endomicrobium sp.]|jgi:antitoxin MazE|nr:AbrB/MazE/SpoVT family DNA-binding domain-containing protein [Endomicrobium sp.]